MHTAQCAAALPPCLTHPLPLPRAHKHPGDSDAYSYLSAKDRASLREQDARQLVWDVLEALLYLHQQVGQQRLMCVCSCVCRHVGECQGGGACVHAGVVSRMCAVDTSACH